MNQVAACGLNCQQCAIWIAASSAEAAERLAEKWRQSGYPAAEPGWFRCQGCWGPPEPHWTADCLIRLCCDRQQLASCGHCQQFVCDQLIGFETDGNASHRAAVQSLRQARSAADRSQ